MLGRIHRRNARSVGKRIRRKIGINIEVLEERLCLSVCYGSDSSLRAPCVPSFETKAAKVADIVNPLEALTDDQLSIDDKTALTQHLNIIANDPGWPQASVDVANAIVSNPQYTAVAWDGFFREYFANEPFTDPLSNYLGYPTFYWFDEAVHIKLQTGLHLPLIELNVNPDWAAAIDAGGSAFADDPTLTQDLYHSQNMLASIATRTTALGVRQAIFDNFTALIDQYPNVLRSSASFDRVTQPYFGILRAQTALTLLASADSSDPMRAALDPAVKAQIADTLDLHDTYATIWNDFTLLLLDNNLSSAEQTTTVHDFLGSVPTHLHNTAAITVNEFLGNTTAYQARSLSPAQPYGAVNIFELDVGAVTENSFPNDVPPGLVDVFTIVLAHEINHVVDAVSVQGNTALADRRQALLDAAGNDSLNYLRSMIPDGFFQSAPQEFIASISNQWFTDSSKTIELGLVRFDAGRPEPLNQALFFADIYSSGTDTTFFYEINTAGVITRTEIPLGRDANGYINELVFNNFRYAFDLDSEGDATGYTVSVAATGRITITFNAQPTLTDSLGQIDSLPESLTWIDEWQTAWLEIWVRVESNSNIGMDAASAIVEYNSEYFSVGTPSGNSVFATFDGNVDDVLGRINVSGSEPMDQVGVNQYVLLARVPFSPVDSGGGVPIRLDLLGPMQPVFDPWLSLADDGGAVVEYGGSSMAVELSAAPGTILYPLLYDLNDDREISFGDFSIFAAAFFRPANTDAASAKSDFNRDGVVDFGDFSLFAGNFFKRPGASIIYPTNFPEAWEPSGVLMSESAAQGQAAFVVDNRTAVRRNQGVPNAGNSGTNGGLAMFMALRYAVPNSSVYLPDAIRLEGDRTGEPVDSDRQRRLPLLPVAVDAALEGWNTGKSIETDSRAGYLGWSNLDSIAAECDLVEAAISGTLEGG